MQKFARFWEGHLIAPVLVVVGLKQDSLMIHCCMSSGSYWCAGRVWLLLRWSLCLSLGLYPWPERVDDVGLWWWMRYLLIQVLNADMWLAWVVGCRRGGCWWDTTCIVILICDSKKGVVRVIPRGIKFGWDVYLHLIGHSQPFGFFVGRCLSWLGWEMVHYLCEPLVEDLNGFQYFGDLGVGNHALKCPSWLRSHYGEHLFWC